MRRSQYWSSYASSQYRDLLGVNAWASHDDSILACAERQAFHPAIPVTCTKGSRKRKGPQPSQTQARCQGPGTQWGTRYQRQGGGSSSCKDARISDAQTWEAVTSSPGKQPTEVSPLALRWRQVVESLQSARHCKAAIRTLECTLATHTTKTIPSLQNSLLCQANEIGCTAQSLQKGTADDLCKSVGKAKKLSVHAAGLLGVVQQTKLQAAWSAA